MTKFKQEIKTPPKSVTIIHELMNDKQLGNTTKKRLTRAYIYGLLRRTYNLSFNDLKHHYLKSYDIVYCINRISTLVDRSGLNEKTIRSSIKDLVQAGYLIKVTNRIKHLTYYELPLVIKNNYLVHPERLKAVAKITKSTGKNYRNHRKKLSEAPVKNTTRCSVLSSSESNDSVVENDHSNKKYGNNKSNRNNIKRINNWIKNTPKKMGIPKSVVKYIGKYLINNNLNSDAGSTIISTITQIKINVNMMYKSTYGTGYYKNETNPYFNDGSLIKSLKDIFNPKLNLDLKDTIIYDYKKYIKENSDLKLNDRGKEKEKQEYYPDVNRIEASINDAYGLIQIYKNYPDYKDKWLRAKSQLDTKLKTYSKYIRKPVKDIRRSLPLPNVWVWSEQDDIIRTPFYRKDPAKIVNQNRKNKIKLKKYKPKDAKELYFWNDPINNVNIRINGTLYYTNEFNGANIFSRKLPELIKKMRIKDKKRHDKLMRSKLHDRKRDFTEIKKIIKIYKKRNPHNERFIYSFSPIQNNLAQSLDNLNLSKGEFSVYSKISNIKSDIHWLKLGKDPSKMYHWIDISQI